MRTIYKYPISIVDRCKFSLPKGAKILTAAAQGVTPYMWAIIDPMQKECENHTLIIVGTGNPVPHDASDYVGSFQHGGGMWHAFTFKE